MDIFKNDSKLIAVKLSGESKMKKVKKVVKVAIIGLGGHFYKSHIDDLLKNKWCKIVGVYDFDSKKMVDFGNKYGEGINQYKKEECVLRDPNVDAVMIFTPDEYHAKSLYHAVQAGKHVFVEKPMAINSSDLELVFIALNIAERKKLVVTSCHPRRFNPPYMWLKKNIRKYSKELGKILSVRMHFSYQKSDTTDKHVGLLMDHISHEIDYINWLLGHSDFTSHKLRDSLDLYEVIGLREKDKISFSFLGVRRLENKSHYESVEVVYEKGVVKLHTSVNYQEVEKNNFFGELSSLGDFVGKVEVCSHENQSSRIQFIPGTNYKESFFGVNKNFIDTIRGVRKNYLSAENLIINTLTSVMLTENNVFVKKARIEKIG